MFFYLAKYVLFPWVWFYFQGRISGKGNVPKKGTPFIVCANHFSALDPVALGVLFPGRIHPMAKAELFEKWYLKVFLGDWLGAFPVKRGEVDLKTIKTSLKLLGDNKVIGIFPEGTRNKTEEIIAEPGVAMLAIKAKVPVIPVSIAGRYKFLGGIKLHVGAPILLEEYYDKKLKSQDYTNISIEIMKKVKELSRED